MKQLLFLCCYCLGCLSGFGQQAGAWQSFWNNDTTLFGFKDAQGKVIIQPSYSSMFFVRKLDHIAALAEQKGEQWDSYYVTRSGKQVARDSLYIFDNASDCESEGFIRFRDPKTGKAGMLNRDGQVVIPAVYNDLSPVHNGMVVVLRNAHKQHWDTAQHSGCDHFSWVGGQELLIDTANRVLIDSFPYNQELDFSSVHITSKPAQQQGRISFKGTDGRYYSFIDMDKEFEHWLQQKLLHQLSVQTMIRHAFPTVCTWSEEEGWIFQKAASVLSRNEALLKAKLKCVQDKTCDYAIVSGTLNQFIYTSDDFNIYFNNCGNAESWRYPTKSIIIDHRNGTDFKQDHFEFLRTPQGYKLICISLGKDTLK
ncbi:WG repeat-containing protein [Edaphocola flava]|uniref:WG repeat-containing protein n=1 Tax=Edaphocola flava TaxID=2499629 RepID=UPI00100C1EEB|nr:WG repeat-containing protein [Edaphocola flava]